MLATQLGLMLSLSTLRPAQFYHPAIQLVTKRLQTCSAKQLKAPEIVDFNVTGTCNMDCKWCWGPEHDAHESLSLMEWKNIAYNLKRLGTKSVVFTGGETLLKKDLPELARYVNSDLGLRTTLSSNGLLLTQRGPSILPRKFKLEVQHPVV